MQHHDQRHPGVHHKDGPLAQVRQMAAWADHEANDSDRSPNRETLHKIATNLRAAADALECPQAVTDDIVERGARALGGYTVENGYSDEDWQAAGDASELREKARRVLLAAARAVCSRSAGSAPMSRIDMPIKVQLGCDYCYRFLLKQTAEHKADVERLREALIPFAFIGRASMAPLGLGDEYDHARALLGLEPVKAEPYQPPVDRDGCLLFPDDE